MGISIGNKEEACRELVRTTLNLWNSLGIDKEMVIKILGEELKGDKPLDIFITDIETLYDTHTYYIGVNPKEKRDTVTGYNVKFILNDVISCKTIVKPERYDGNREHLIEYIKSSINQKKGSE